VSERTSALRKEKDTLEQRVRDRTRQLERAKRAALATERSLFDRGRREGVRHMAAGLAHELNNPLAAVAVNLKFALELIDGVTPGAGLEADWLTDLSEAVHDAAAEAELVAARVSSISVRDVSAGRRAAGSTNLHEAVTEAATHFRQVFPSAPAPSISGPADLLTAIQPAELTRWLFRLLSGLTAPGDAEACIRLGPGADGPHVEVELAGSAATGATETLAAISEEVLHYGGHVDADLGVQRCRIGISLPAPMGARGTATLWERTA
jgi:signal transduction histidine kinase